MGRYGYRGERVGQMEWRGWGVKVTGMCHALETMLAWERDFFFQNRRMLWFKV